MDLCPTLLDLVGLPIPFGVQGQSCKALFAGEETSWREAAYIEFDAGYHRDMRLRQLRSKDWALTYDVRSTDGLLFDLDADPDELCNLWNVPEYRDIRQDLLLQLLETSSLADDWLPSKKSHA